jgi:hypothetical protein
VSASIPSANGIKYFTPKLCDAPLFVTMAGETEVAFGIFIVELAEAIALAFIELVVDIHTVTEVVFIFDMDVVFIFAMDVVFILLMDVVLAFAMPVMHDRGMIGIVTVDVTVTVLTFCVSMRFTCVSNLSDWQAYHRYRSSVNHFERMKE